jgi:hypothetical protein
MLANSEMNISSSERVTIDVPGTFKVESRFSGRLRRTADQPRARSTRCKWRPLPCTLPPFRRTSPKRQTMVGQAASTAPTCARFTDWRTGLKLKNTRQRCKFETSLVAEALA